VAGERLKPVNREVPLVGLQIRLLRAPQQDDSVSSCELITVYSRLGCRVKEYALIPGSRRHQEGQAVRKRATLGIQNHASIRTFSAPGPPSNVLSVDENARLPAWIFVRVRLVPRDLARSVHGSRPAGASSCRRVRPLPLPCGMVAPLASGRPLAPKPKRSCSQWVPRPRRRTGTVESLRRARCVSPLVAPVCSVSGRPTRLSPCADRTLFRGAHPRWTKSRRFLRSWTRSIGSWRPIGGVLPSVVPVDNIDVLPVAAFVQALFAGEIF